MSLFFFVAAAILFFLAGVGASAIPNAVTWGLCAMAIGLAIGDRWPLFVQKSP